MYYSAITNSFKEGAMSETLNLESTIKADVERYKRILKLYSSQQASTGESMADDSDDHTENTKETERHLENVIRELEALLRDRNAREEGT
jgi:hypothetical protein